LEFDRSKYTAGPINAYFLVGIVFKSLCSHLTNYLPLSNFRANSHRAAAVRASKGPKTVTEKSVGGIECENDGWLSAREHSNGRRLSRSTSRQLQKFTTPAAQKFAKGGDRQPEFVTLTGTDFKFNNGNSIEASALLAPGGTSKYALNGDDISSGLFCLHPFCLPCLKFNVLFVKGSVC